MGQYFKFVNTTKQQESNISLPFNFGLSWTKNLNNCDEKEIAEIFEFVIKGNDWDEEDEVIAIGDYGDIVYRPSKD
jgi:hypothetical protein